jgi:molybdopterin synthase catalytic subunit
VCEIVNGIVGSVPQNGIDIPSKWRSGAERARAGGVVVFVGYMRHF